MWGAAMTDSKAYAWHARHPQAKTAAASRAEICAGFGSYSLSISKLILITLRYRIYKSYKATINNNGKP